MESTTESRCWLCGHALTDDGARRGAEGRAGDARCPEFETGSVCQRCYYDFGVCPPGRRYTVRIETRLAGLSALHARAALLRGVRAEFAS